MRYRKMKKMSKVLCLAMASVMAIGMTACGGGEKTDFEMVKEKGKIRVGITDYAPMDYKENGKWIGFDAELAEMFAEELGVECEFFEIIDWETKVAELNSMQFDLIWNGMTASDELAKSIDLSIPYAKNSQVLVVEKTKEVTIDTVKNMSIAVEKGSAGDIVVTEQGFEKVNCAGNMMGALMEVTAQTSEGAIIDLTMAESVVGKGNFADLKIEYDVQYGAEVFSVGLRKGSDLTEKLNAFLKAKYADGTMTKLLEKYAVSLNTEALAQ